jgi:hypothetical protein
MNKIKIAYYILLLISAFELGRGLQLIYNPLFWDSLYPYARLTSLLQIIISALLFIVARILKPVVIGKSL